MNTVNTYPWITKWCERYFEKSGLKVHPSSVPVDLVLEDILDALSVLSIPHEITAAKIKKLEFDVHMLQVELRSAIDRLDAENIEEPMQPKKK